MNIIIKHTNVYILLLLLLLLLLELSCLRYHIFLYKPGFYRNNLELKKAHNIPIVLNLKKKQEKRDNFYFRNSIGLPNMVVEKLSTCKLMLKSFFVMSDIISGHSTTWLETFYPCILVY
jgi:hypothetical protein